MCLLFLLFTFVIYLPCFSIFNCMISLNLFLYEFNNLKFHLCTALSILIIHIQRGVMKIVRNISYSLNQNKKSISTNWPQLKYHSKKIIFLSQNSPAVHSNFNVAVCSSSELSNRINSEFQALSGTFTIQNLQEVSTQLLLS